MNIEINESQSFSMMIEKICEKDGANPRKIKKQFGQGVVYNIQPDEGLNLFIMDVVFRDPFLVRWNLEPTIADEFYLSQNQRIGQITNGIEKIHESTIEEGVVFFTRGRERRRLWLPNNHYQVCMLTFTYKWFNQIKQAITMPESIVNYLSTTKNAYLHIPFNATLSFVIKQMVDGLVASCKEIDFSYIQIKCLEFVYQSLQLGLSDYSNIKSGNKIHPEDLQQIISFINELPSSLIDIPTLHETAELMGMSDSKFQRVFKKGMGSSFYHEVLNIRMLKGMELLMDG